MGTPHIASRQQLCSGKFIKYEMITWEDAKGQARLWEAAERVRGVQAVLIIPWMRPSNQLVLIRQFRPPTGVEVIEFPAGLMEPGESPDAAAVREMREETGYECKIKAVQPETFNSPGLTSETVFNVVAEVADGAECRPCPDDGENIETVLVPLDQIGAFVQSEVKQGHRFDSKVWSYLHGLLVGQSLKK